MNAVYSAPEIPPGLKKVPPFPPVAAKLLTLFSHPDVEVAQVAGVIGSDPTLSARLLQRANSMEFGFSSPVSSIHQAVALLGFDRTRQVTVALATATYAKNLMTAEMLRCWHHSLATAVLAEEIAHSAGAFVNVAFVAGILHDVGRLALLVAFPREYLSLIRRVEQNCIDILDSEQQEFGMNHAESGRLLAETWCLPQELGMIMGRHHDSCDGGELDLLRIVHVACRLAVVLGFGVIPPQGQPDFGAVLEELPAQARKGMRKSPEELCAEIEERINTFS